MDLTRINNYSDIQCHTDLSTCCHRDFGEHRGDWYFPNGSRLQFLDSGYSIYEKRKKHRIELCRRNNGVANGIYQCAIETIAVHRNDSSDKATREIVYLGLYASGGEMSYLHAVMSVYNS